MRTFKEYLEITPEDEKHIHTDFFDALHCSAAEIRRPYIKMNRVEHMETLDKLCTLFGNVSRYSGIRAHKLEGELISMQEECYKLKSHIYNSVGEFSVVQYENLMYAIDYTLIQWINMAHRALGFKNYGGIDYRDPDYRESCESLEIV